MTITGALGMYMRTRFRKYFMAYADEARGVKGRHGENKLNYADEMTTSTCYWARGFR